MCSHGDHHSNSISISRREAIGAGLGAGLGALAGLVGVPRLLSASATSATNAFAPHEAQPPLSELDVALRAAKWVRRARIETRNGVAWPANPREPTGVGYDLYNGMPGVVLFHLELFHSTGDASWLDDARLGGNELIAQLPAIDAEQAAGLYEGLGGAAFVLEETHRATGDGRYRDAAKRAVEMIRNQAQRAGAGIAWTKSSATNDIISGSAGIGLVLLWAHRTLGDTANRDAAIAAGRRLVDVGQPERGGLKWVVAPGVKNLYPNFSHGTAGVAYFLATLGQAANDRTFVDAAIAGATYLEAAANTDDGGLKVFHHEPGGEALFYLSWCHGPAGTSRLFHRLAEVTHDERWHELVRRGARATIASGVPERQSPGYWNNISQCCGNAGVGEYFLALQRTVPDASYAALVRRVAEDTLRRATVEGDGLKWIQAENRVSPNDVIAQTGYMQGAAGVGSLYLHIDGAARGRKPAIVWPDSPFA
jgi:lantibiotic modifying enzyme